MNERNIKLTYKSYKSKVEQPEGVVESSQAAVWSAKFLGERDQSNTGRRR